MEDIKYIKEQLQTLSEQLQKLYHFQLKPMLSVEEAAFYLNVTKSTLYKYTSSNIIAFYKPTGKLISFKKEDLDNWLETRRVPSNRELQERNIFTNHSKLNHGKA